jgi:hypothetical protein
VAGFVVCVVSKDAIAGKPAPTGYVSNPDHAANTNPCGSGLAREEAGTSNINIACQSAIASKLAPTGIGV